MTEKKTPATKARKPQGAAAPSRPRRKPPARPQSAAVPGAPRAGQSRQLPPLTPEQLAYFGSAERLGLVVAECVPQDATQGDILRLLLEAQRLKADPLRGDVYLARAASRDGSGIGYTVAAKRDTLLAYAECFADFEGFDAQAIYKGDKFARVDPTPDGTLRQRGGISHTSEGLEPPEDERPLGAWCVVARQGRPVVTFVARSSEYLPADEWPALDAEDPRKRYPDRYMVKVAMCWPLRMLYGLTDVVGAEELSARPAALPDMREPAVPAMFADGPRDALDTRIVNAHRDAQILDPMLWPPAKVRGRLASARALADETGGDPAVFDQARDEIASEIERDVQLMTARRRDPAALLARLKELRAFDPSTLDADDLRDYQTERAAVEAAAAAAGLDVAAA